MQFLGDGGDVKEVLRKVCEGECLKDTDECYFILLTLERVSDVRLLKRALRDLIEIAEELGCESEVKELLGAMFNK